MKHKIGEQIYIKHYEVGRDVDHLRIIMKQAKYMCKGATITSYTKVHDTEGYRLDIDDGQFIWTDNSFGQPPVRKYPTFR